MHPRGHAVSRILLVLGALFMLACCFGLVVLGSLMLGERDYAGVAFCAFGAALTFVGAQSLVKAAWTEATP
jgi:hypothetical protein